TVSIDPSAGNVELLDTRVLAIASGATGTITSDGTWFGFGGTVTNAGVLTVTGNSAIGPPITNTGTLNKTSTGTTIFNQTFANSGTVNVDAGTLSLRSGDGGSTAGTFNVADAAVLDLQGGGYTLTSTAQVIG